MQSNRIAVVAFAAALIPLAGCQTILIKEGIGAIKGAQAKAHPVSAVPAGSMARFNSINFEPCTTETSTALTPATLLSAYDKAAGEFEAKPPKEWAGGGSAITVRTALWYFQAKGIFSGGEVIGRARISDGGSLIGDLVVRGESESFLAGSEKAMGSAVVNAIVAYLTDQKGPAKRD